jgi:hypothetical protein
MIKRAAKVWIAIAIALASGAANAGRSCESQPPNVDAIDRAMTLAEHTAQRLDQSGAQVVLLARIGQNLSAYRLRYSHVGLAYQDEGKWRVVHKLNQCGTANGAVYRQGLGEFFLDDLYDYEAAIVVPTLAAQARLLPTLRDNQSLAQLNTPAYNMLAYPWSQTYQQSNQWVIETFALAQEPAASTRERAQAWLKFQGYEPTTLNISAPKRLAGRLTAANIAFDDHPNAKRFTDRIETVTVDSVFAWLNRSGLGGPVQVIR